MVLSSDPLTGPLFDFIIANVKTQLQATEQSHQNLMSLRQAAIFLGVNRNWLSAYLKGRGVRLVQIGPSLCIQRSVIEKIGLELPRKKEA